MAVSDHAAGKRVVIIGGGDTGSDCVGVANRQKAASILQFDRNARLPEHVDKSMVWPMQTIFYFTVTKS